MSLDDFMKELLSFFPEKIGTVKLNPKVRPNVL